MDICDALKLIATRSGAAQRDAIRALRSTGHAQKIRFNLVAEHALTDYAAAFTAEERDAILALIDWPEDGPRTERLSIRLTEAEKATMQALAASETGGDLSELVRRRVLGS